MSTTMRKSVCEIVFFSILILFCLYPRKAKPVLFCVVASQLLHSPLTWRWQFSLSKYKHETNKAMTKKAQLATPWPNKNWKIRARFPAWTGTSLSCKNGEGFTSEIDRGDRAMERGEEQGVEAETGRKGLRGSTWGTSYLLYKNGYQHACHHKVRFYTLIQA